MRHLIRLLIISILFISASGCSKSPCDDLENGVYTYPEAGGKSLAESFELYKIPEQVLRCISTEGLIKSCLTYPEMRMIWTRNSLQQGFDYIEDKCNGFEELWIREDKNRSLIDLYTRLNFKRDWTDFTLLENGEYIDDIIRYELILAQEEVLLDLTEQQKLQLFQLTLNNQKFKLESIDYFGGLGVASSQAILSRIMLNDQYQPFLEKYSNDGYIKMSVDLIQGLDAETREQVMTISEEYLELLKTR
jgi:hypothetical protein